MKEFFSRMIQKNEFFIFLFIIPAVAFLIGLEWNLINVLFVIATELTLAHAIYVSYAVLKRQEKLNFIQYTLLGTIWIGMLLFFSEWNTLLGWFLRLVVILFIGVIFHWYTVTWGSQSKTFKDFCKGKLYVDLVGLFLGICGVIFVKLSQRDLLLAILNLGIIILINYVIFFKLELFNKIGSQSQ